MRYDFRVTGPDERIGRRHLRQRVRAARAERRVLTGDAPAI